MRSMLLTAVTLFIASCAKEPTTPPTQPLTPAMQQEIQKYSLLDALSVDKRELLWVGQDEYNYQVQTVRPNGHELDPDSFDGHLIQDMKDECYALTLASVKKGSITSTSGIVNTEFSCLKKRLSANPVTHDYTTYLIPKATRLCPTCKEIFIPTPK